MRSSSRRVALVTGGTDGIGKEVARGLARAGHRVFVVGRDIEKGGAAEEELRASTSNDDVFFVRADLSLLRDADRLAAEIVRRSSTLHYLVHSAGIVRGRQVLTEEGIESNFAVNYASRFALTVRLLPVLLASGRPEAAARIVIIGGAAQNGTIDFDDVNLSRGFSTIRAVRQFCEANDVFTIELARRLAVADSSPRVTITSLKVGVVKTNIRREFPTWMKVLVPLLMDPLLGQTPTQAAEAALKLLLAGEMEGVSGALFLKIRKLKLAPRRLDPAREEGRRLWDLSEALVANAVRADDTPDDAALRVG